MTVPLSGPNAGIIPPLSVRSSPPAYRPLPHFLFSSSASSSASAVSLQARYFDGGSDEIGAFITQPLDGGRMSFMTDLEFQAYGLTGSVIGSGCYSSSGASGTEWGAVPAGSADLAAATDRTSTSFVRIAVCSVSAACPTVGVALKIRVPQAEFDFDQAYLGIKAVVKGSFASSAASARKITLRCIARAFVGANRNGFIRSASYDSDALPWQERSLASIMDEYFIDNPNNGNRSLFYPSAAGDQAECTGCGNFAITPLTSADSLRTIGEIGVFLEAEGVAFWQGIGATLTSGSATVPLGSIGGSDPGCNHFKAGDQVYFSGADFPAAKEDAFYTVQSVDTANNQLTLTTAYAGALSGDQNKILQPVFMADLYEVCLMYRRSVSIGSAIYAPLSGRSFGGSGETPDGSGKVWGGRKPSADMIATAPEMLEHLKRLQNWSELGLPTVDIGKSYDGAAKIRTGNADGSFDRTAAMGAGATLGEPSSFRPAFQIGEADEAWTETTGRRLCKSFGILSYIDAEGRECVESFVKRGAANLTEGLTFRDLTESPGQVVEPQQQDVFCEPIVQYGYDPGPQEFRNLLAVSNANAASWSRDYTPGFDNVSIPGNFTNGWCDPLGLYGSDRPLGIGNVCDGEYVWTFCNRLFRKYGQVEKCGADFSEQRMIVRYVDALGYLIMRFRVMQFCRIELCTFYTKARRWHFGMHVTLLLPMLGSGGPYECLVERISKDKAKNRVRMTLVVLDEIED